MAKHHGKNGKMKIGSSVVAETTSWSIVETVPTADTTAQGDAAQTHLTGIPGWTATVEGHYDPADATGQEVLLNGASVSVGFYSDGDAAGKVYYSGTASITERRIGASHTDRVTFQANLQGNGALARQTVSA